MQKALYNRIVMRYRQEVEGHKNEVLWMKRQYKINIVNTQVNWNEVWIYGGY